MRSLKFPSMFNSNSTKVWKKDEYLEQTKQNTKLLLSCEKGELFGDPYFGIKLKRYLFDQNNYILRDVIIDEVYTQLALFIPQLVVNRKDIEIVQDTENGKLICNIKGKNQIDFTNDMYSIVLYSDNIE